MTLASTFLKSPLRSKEKHMIDQNETSPPINKKRRKGRKKLWWFLLTLPLLPLLLWGSLFLNNNLSLTSDQAFAENLDQAIKRAAHWVHENDKNFKERKNFALARMLQDIDAMTGEPVYLETTEYFLDMSLGTLSCWKRLLDPQWQVSTVNINKAIREEKLDYKWILYAIATDQARLTEDTMNGLFNTQRWKNSVLTHQLWALIHLRQRNGNSKEWDTVIQQLCQRLSQREKIAIGVYDIYIQRVGFILFAGHPELINRRWVERIIGDQDADGGWNDRWFCFRSVARKPTLDINQPSTQHATVQALWTLMQIKHRYPQHFGLQ